MSIGEYVNWTEGNAIVPHENPRRPRPFATTCSVHRWFDGGDLRCTYCRVRVHCACGLAGLDEEERAGIPLPLLLGRQATLDHFVPTSRGGADAADNVVVACRRCNSSKQANLFAEEWIPDRDRHTYISPGQPMTPPPGLGIRARRIAQLMAALDPDDGPLSVAEVCRQRGWRTSDVHLALGQMLGAKALYAFAHPCWPPQRYLHPVSGPDDALAGRVWLDGWS
ncbi:HNH endonuclease [Streptomyces sp. TLI_146]|uniref:HNH endonuclease n=1 Tax=Streptomyces sp. TLI_146 TaxID=1938858 RepID=UPI000CB2737A|nr:HNH endonuclease [Streptomyces sp. TLI_146]PKV85804.1 HNH endonuclease [Streptomyces sp. TLI_146]